MHLRDYNNIQRWMIHLQRWMTHLLTIPAFKETTEIETAKRGYYLCSYHRPDKLTPYVPLGNGGFD